MPSHLTRRIFYRILANEPIVARGCLRRRHHHLHLRSYTTPFRQELSRTVLSSIRNGVVYTAPRTVSGKRTFFNLNMFAPKQRDTKEPDIDPGIEDMMHLAKMQRLKARVPPVKDIVAALNTFLQYKQNRKQSMSDTHAALVLQSLRYCMGPSPDRPHVNIFKRDFILCLLQVLELSHSRPSTSHLDLCLALVEEAKSWTWEHELYVTRICVKMMGNSGRALEARDLAQAFENTDPSVRSAVGAEGTPVQEDGPKMSRRKSRQVPILWLDVLSAVANESSESELLSAMEKAKSSYMDPRPNPVIPSIMFTFYVRQNNAEALKSWFSQLWSIRTKQFSDKSGEYSQAMAQELHTLLQWCLQNGELEFGHRAVRQATVSSPSKPVWDTIFIWAAGTGKGADEIARMLDVMEKSNEEVPDPDQWRIPDIDTINGLVEYATSKSDPYLAERFIAIGKDKGIEPNARTYQLQIDYRLDVNDVDGALIAYKNLQAMDLSSNKDVPTVNHLIVALCRSRRHDFDTVMNVAMDLSDRKARFDPETVATLAKLHLSRDEVADVTDLLNTHAYHYSSAEREGIKDTIVDFCIDPNTSTSRSWDTYSILRTVFDETARSQRTEIMKNFFRRGRPDMAVHVFTGMRHHSRLDTIPTIDTYVAAFLGSAKIRDLDSLEVIHNQLKLDYNINLNTYINNALIIGYTACGEARKALGFWNDIVASKEGPTYNSIHVALRACEQAPFGDVRAQELWGKLRKMKVDLDQSLWASYAGALAGNGNNELAIATIEEAESKGEVEIDTFLLGSFHAGAQNAAKQSEIQQWAQDKYPDLWAELEATESETNEEGGVRKFKIDRSVTP